MIKSVLMLSVLLMAWGQNVGAETIKKPKPNDENRVYTLNKMGAMSLTPGKVDQEYLNTLRPGQKVMDVGCAYGETVKAAALKGVQVWANDLDERHLQILKEEVENAGYKNLIHYVPGDFTGNITVDENTFDKVLMAHVLHFFDGPKVEQALVKALKILKPGGEIYILVTSPYMKVW